jgi:hypothetical protein
VPETTNVELQRRADLMAKLVQVWPPEWPPLDTERLYTLMQTVEIETLKWELRKEMAGIMERYQKEVGAIVKEAEAIVDRLQRRELLATEIETKQ